MTEQLRNPEVVSKELIEVFLKENGELREDVIDILPETIEKGGELNFVLTTLSSFKLPQEFFVANAAKMNKITLAVDGHITTQVIENDMEGFQQAVALAYLSPGTLTENLLNAIYDESIHPLTHAEVTRGALEMVLDEMTRIAMDSQKEEGENSEEYLNALSRSYEEMFDNLGGFLIAGIEQNVFEESQLLAALHDWTWVFLNGIMTLEAPDEIKYRLQENQVTYAITKLDEYRAIRKALEFAQNCFDLQEEYNFALENQNDNYYQEVADVLGEEEMKTQRGRLILKAYRKSEGKIDLQAIKKLTQDTIQILYPQEEVYVPKTIANYIFDLNDKVNRLIGNDYLAECEKYIKLTHGKFLPSLIKESYTERLQSVNSSLIAAYGQNSIFKEDAELLSLLGSEYHDTLDIMYIQKLRDWEELSNKDAVAKYKGKDYKLLRNLFIELDKQVNK